MIDDIALQRFGAFGIGANVSIQTERQISFSQPFFQRLGGLRALMRDQT